MSKFDSFSLPGALASDPELPELRPHFKIKVGYILAELEAQGFQPRIANAYRSAKEQRAKYAAGMSKTYKPGHHNWGAACDVIDRRWGWPQSHSSRETWDNAARFFVALRDACDRHDVACGGWWFGERHPDGTKATAQNPTHSSIWNQYGLGWDVAHCYDHKLPREMRVEYHGRAAVR